MYAAQKDVLAEMKALKIAGGATVVENTTIGIKRDLEFLRQVQKEVRVVARLLLFLSLPYSA